MQNQRTKSIQPIAIVGIGCRFPGDADTPGAFWRLLRDGIDAIGEIPPDRWDIAGYYDPEPGKPGKSCTRRGGFIRGIDQFDPGFFGISPREADFMDPQQRLLLEAAWEAIEDGGQVLDLVRGSDTGVFVGISTTDYSLIQGGVSERGPIDAYSTTGTTMSIAANRVSYCFNFLGPSVAMDTACSSALVAVHAACRSLRNGECSLAVAGGVNALIGVAPFQAFSSMAMVSPDGRCKAFDAAADGFVRAEGVGVVLLKPLAASLRAGDPIRAVIRASGVNQDGRTAGMTVPSLESQRALIERVCREAGVKPADIGYAEAHGTGTAVGDPVEAEALGTALRPGREVPLVIGSVKTNIGHMEAGAGAAGLIKAALALENGLIPPSLHFKTPNPAIDFDGLKLRVAQGIEPFPGSPRRLACVNSFGFGGTNAHLLLEAPPERAGLSEEVEAPARPWLLPLSARSPEALSALAGQVAGMVRQVDHAPRDICYSAALRRNHHRYRVCAAGRTPEALAASLEAFAAGGEPRSAERIAEPRLVFVFSGQGPQWWGMGRELFETEPVYRAAIIECGQALDALGAGWSLLEELQAGESRSRMAETAIAQPAICAVQIALAALWRSWGVTPDAVTGHSVGEVAAAHAAGVLSLGDAMRVIYHRGRCMERAASGGRMLAAALTPAEAAELVEKHNGALVLAAINGPASVTLSGDAEAIEAAAASLTARSVFNRPVPVNYAFHSARMDPVREELVAALRGIRPRAGRLPIYSTVTGRRAGGRAFHAAYWWRNVRLPVLFGPAIERLLEDKYNLFLEIAPHPVLSASIRETAQNRSAAVFHSLRRKADEQLAMIEALGGLHDRGCPVDWRAIYPRGRFARLPLYPWQRQRHWHESMECGNALRHPPHHPLLNRRLDSADPAWTVRLDRKLVPWLQDHRAQGHVLFPAAGYLEMALGAGREVFGGRACQLEEIEFQRAFFIPGGDEPPLLELIHYPGEHSFSISSRANDSSEDWQLHACGKMRAAERAEPAAAEPREAILSRCPREIAGAEVYPWLAENGLQYGPAFQGIERAWGGEGEALGEVKLAGTGDFLIHPALLDSCFQVIFAALGEAAPGRAAPRGGVFLPVMIGRMRLHRKPEAHLWSHARITRRTAKVIEADIRISDCGGQTVAEIHGLRCQAVEGMRAFGESLDDLFYEVRWLPQPLEGAAPPDADFLPDPVKLGTSLRREAKRLGRELRTTARDAAFHERRMRLETGYIIAALSRLGWAPRPGEEVTLPGLMAQLCILPKYERLLGRYLGLLAEDGLLERRDAGWRVSKAAPGLGAAPMIDIGREWRALVFDQPTLQPDYALLDRCGRALAAVLHGETDPLHLLFPDGGMDTLDHFYSSGESCRLSNLLARAAMEACVAALPDGRPLRILEIGAGTGGLTANLLPVLPPGQAEYVFTDISKLFLPRAEQRAKDYPFLKTATLDIEQDPLGQGFAPHSFDIVAASNALHATADLRATLRHIRSLLAPGGLLMVIEIDCPSRGFDFMFGPIDGYWRFTDFDLRPDYPLLNPGQWRALLEASGFHGAAAVSDKPGKTVLRQTLLLACAPSVPGGDIPVNGSADGDVWILLADRGGVAEELAACFREHGSRCVLVFPGADPRAALAELAVLDQPPRGVAHLWSLDAPATEALDSAALDEAQTLVTHSVVSLAQALAESQTRLFLVTRGAQPAGAPAALSMAQTPLCGLARVIVAEYPNLRPRQIDLCPSRPRGEARRLFEELSSTCAEPEIALRGEQGRFVQRLAPRSALEGSAAQKPVPVHDHPCRVETTKPGVLDHLMLRAFEPAAPGPGEVEIETAAAALNFRDVMKALAIYPGDAPDAEQLGDECAGRIVAVGPGVTGFAVGDEVCAIARGAFASRVTTPAALVMRKPPRFTPEEAATVLVAFTTAYYALHHLAHMREGERVLIHAATGGVGLAALQLAREAGAEVFATAGTPEKREFLKALGVAHVMDSRTLSFAAEIMEITGGSGIDIVLNSLAGEAIAKSLGVLGPYGRFLEIGKRDIYQNTRIGLRPFRNNLSYFAIDLGGALDPAMMSGFLRELRKRFNDHRLGPLPHRVFPLADFKSAFRHMAQAKQIGKLVLDFSCGKAPVIPAPVVSPIRFRADATYLITGGLGGFGIATARWLAGNGARHLVLTSRGGVPGAEAQEALDALDADGVRIFVEKSDVGDEASVRELIGRIARTMPPLAGVIHAAMVLDDGLLADLDAGRFRKVMAPKGIGAWNLHCHTRALPLDFFILYSSLSSIGGNLGQGNYAAANSFLDALAHHRRAHGLPALAVNWGAIADTGYVARNHQMRDHLARQGWIAMDSREALDALGRLMQEQAVQTGVLRMDRARNMASLPQLSHLAAGPRADAEDASSSQAVRESIAAAPAASRQGLIETVLAAQVAAVLRIAVEKIERDKPLPELGLDSLMAVELLNRIQEALGVSLPAGHFASGPSISKLAATLAGMMAGDDNAAAPAVPPPPAPEAVPARTIQDEVRWDETITRNANAPDPAAAASPSALFLTGASTLAGAYVLRRLLDETAADIYCLEDAGGATDALAGIRAGLESCSLLDGADQLRIIPVAGRLGKPRFGLSESQFDTLSQTVDAVYHLGALVRHLSPYSIHEAANVGGALEALRLAAHGRPKALHYYSSLSVFSGIADGRIIVETDEPGDPARLLGGYAESRWVAEKLMREAQARGFPVSIYRPGLLIGDGGDGGDGGESAVAGDLVWRLVKHCIHLGLAPGSDLDLYLTPVDFVAAAMVRLSRRPDAAGRCYHLINPHPASLDDVLAAATAYGYNIRKVPMAEWEARSTRAANLDARSSVLPYLLLLPEHNMETVRGLSRMPVYDCANVTAGLAGSGIECPRVESATLQRCFERFIQAGEWPAPLETQPAEQQN